jgi:serine/threonine protein kinase
MKPMPEKPPAQLVAMLERLGLATAGQVARMGRRVRRLARDLPRFESVWVDALAQTRVLTPFQAAEINAGRGESLRIGPYVLCERLPTPCYVPCYRAIRLDSGEMVRLAVIENAAAHVLAQLESLVGCVKRTSESLLSPLAPITHAGADGDRLFAAAPWVEGRTAAEWIVHHGRFPPEVVLEIARAMLAGLVELQQAGICHGDVSASGLILGDDGRVTLTMPGLRGVVRPEEGYAHADLLPEAYDSLAPERITAGTPPNTASDIYASGCVWWRLLCGRPPLAGGNSLAKLRAAHAAEIGDVRRFAPEVPAALAGAIAACLEREPNRRPESLAALAAMLGAPTRTGKEALADCLARAGRPAVRWTTTVRSVRKSNRTPLWLAGAVCCLATLVAVVWPFWHGRSEQLAVGNEKGSGFRVQASESANPKSQIPNPKSTNPSSPVVPAAYQQEEKPPPDLVLPAEKPLAVESLDLRRGQCVHGPSGKRAMLLVPRNGLAVNKEDVRFENIDFVWRHNADGAEDRANEEPALVRLLAGRAEFRGCSFQASGHGATLPAAIRWMHPVSADEAATTLPSGRVRLTDCVLHHVGAGLDCRTAGALGIEIINSLHLGAGALLRLDHCPKSDEPVALSLAQVTLRGGGPLWECLVPQVDNQPGEVTIQAAACVFAPDVGTPLLRLCGPREPGRLLSSIRWTGQGSLVTPGAAICAWRQPNGRQETLDEGLLSIAGLVRGAVGFAGEASDDPAASRAVRWQAPLQSANPPGIDPAPLPTPQR